MKYFDSPPRIIQGWDVYERTRFDGECRGRRDGNRGDGGTGDIRGDNGYNRDGANSGF